MNFCLLFDADLTSSVFSCEAKNDFGNDSRDFVVIIPSEFKF